jgi:hypothetical protein
MRQRTLGILAATLMLSGSALGVASSIVAHRTVAVVSAPSASFQPPPGRRLPIQRGADGPYFLPSGVGRFHGR